MHSKLRCLDCLAPGGVTYYYNGAGERVAKSNGKLYWFGTNSSPLVESTTSGSTLAQYIFFNGKRVAMRKPDNSAHYYFVDQIGSANIVTNATGVMPPEQDIEYHPYGEQQVYIDTSGQEYRFTGHEHDPETNDDYFDARYYSSTFGRFLTPDWSATPKPIPYVVMGNPQTLNLYSYVENNPITGTDPDGHCGNGDAGCTPEQQAADAKKAKEAAAKQLKELLAFLKKAEAEFRSFQKKGAKDIDWFNSYLGFGKSNCSGGGDCANAVGMAGTAIITAFISGGESEGVSVYRILGREGETIYVGITNNLERRAGEHGAVLQEIIGGLSRTDARAVEQRLIKEYGLSKEGGTLLNKINSIARKNPIYDKALIRGEQLLRSKGFILTRTTI